MLGHQRLAAIQVLFDGAGVIGPALWPVGAAPSIRADDLEARGWTLDDLGFALRAGPVPGGDGLGGRMAGAVTAGTAFLNPEDLHTMAPCLLERNGHTGRVFHRLAFSTRNET